MAPAFAERRDAPALRRKHGVAGDRPLVLVLGGGFGVGPVESLVEGLLSGVRGAELVVVAGRNEALRRRLAKRAALAPLPTRVLGFTGEMHEWMALAALAVTKPGGLTTSEALASGLPLGGGRGDQRREPLDDRLPRGAAPGVARRAPAVADP